MCGWLAALGESRDLKLKASEKYADRVRQRKASSRFRAKKLETVQTEIRLQRRAGQSDEEDQQAKSGGERKAGAEGERGSG